jgi:hypothetical protein
MKEHYGFITNCGDYESPLFCCDETLCGCVGEEVLEEHTTDIWDIVTCKKCLRMKGAVIEGQKEDEKHIVEQMGDMADFMEREEKNKKGVNYEHRI